MTPVEVPELLVADQVSELTTISVPTLQAWAALADKEDVYLGPPHIRLSPRKRVWAKEDVVAWIEEKRGQ